MVEVEIKVDSENHPGLVFLFWIVQRHDGFVVDVMSFCWA